MFVCVTNSARHAQGPGLAETRALEAANGLDCLETYDGFTEKAEECRRGFLAFLAETNNDGRTVVGYGAAAKGNTLLNFAGVTPSEIPYVVDRSPHKQN